MQIAGAVQIYTELQTTVYTSWDVQASVLIAIMLLTVRCQSSTHERCSQIVARLHQRVGVLLQICCAFLSGALLYPDPLEEPTNEVTYAPPLGSPRSAATWGSEGVKNCYGKKK